MSKKLSRRIYIYLRILNELMITFNKKNKEGKDNQPVINLYKKEDFNDDYKLNKDIHKPNDIIYFDSEAFKDDNEDDERDDFCFIKELNGMTPWPHIEKGKLFRMSIAGSSGTGKTSLTLSAIKMFIDANDGKAFVIYYNANESDEPMERYLKKICNDQLLIITPKLMIDNYNENLKKKPNQKVRLFYTIQDIKDIIFSKANYETLLVFDDWEGCTNKTVKQQIQLTMNEVLSMGRARTSKQSNISCIIINHQVLQAAATKALFNEVNFVCLHLRSVSNSNIDNVLGVKCGYDENIIKLIKKMKKQGAGFTFISRCYPYIIMSDKGIIFQS